MSSVTLSNVEKTFDSAQVIRDVDLTIEDGHFCVIVGPSGCGKSTLLRMIAGLESVSAGTVKIGSRDVTNVDPAARGVAMVFQTYALYPHMTVAENIGFGLKMNKVDKSTIDKKVNEAADILKLQDYLDRKPKALSGGQRQRVAIGRAIVRDPEVFLFDEPLSNLDAELRVEMRVELARLHKDIGATMIYVTHDQVEAMTLADTIIVLRAGKVEQAGSPMTLYQDPDNIFVAGFIGSPSMNFCQGVVEKKGVRIPALDNTLVRTKAKLPAEQSTVTVGIRPQDITLDTSSDGYVVDLIEQLGVVAYVYLISPAGDRFVIESKDTVDPSIAKAGVQFDHSDVYFFDTDTGQRLR